MNERDMYYGYGGFTPLNSFGQMPGNMQGDNMPNNYTNSIFNDMKNRIDRLERQVKRIDQRLMRLEAPYSNNNFNNEPDNDMYIM